jgi:hypothetical protein
LVTHHGAPPGTLPRMFRPLAWLAPFLVAAWMHPASATTYSTDFTDLWWNPAESGWGLNLVQQHDTLFATLFVYGADDTPRWYVASSLTPGSAANTFTGTLFEARGPYFGAGSFDPAAAGVVTVGSMSVSFASPTAATLTYNVGAVSVTKPITRQTWRTNVLAGTYRGGLVASGAGCRSATNPGGTVEAFDTMTVTANGSLLAFRVDFTRSGAASTCTYTGTYSQSGRLGSVSAGAFTCTSGSTTTSQGAFALEEVQASVQGFTAAFTGTDAACSFSGRFGGLRAALPAEVAASGLSPFASTCGDFLGTAYVNAEVEPHLAVNPRNPNHWVGNWQQDRFSNGAARGLVTGVTFDGGRTWTHRTATFSHCSGGNAQNGGDFSRATDPWVTFSPDGTVHQSALAVSGTSFTPSGRNAIFASRSTDGGLTWSTPIALIRDSGNFFNDKETITADPHDARFVYATWDRLESGAGGPTYFARTLDGGVSWESARAIFDPGESSQTIGNLIRVLPDGTLVNLFTQIDEGPNNTQQASLNVVRSGDRGATWGEPVRINTLSPLGARDPLTNIAIRDGSIIAQMAVAPDGALYVAWQDGRFTQARDAIALSRSSDGGRTWSAPVRVNADPNVVAFMPQVHVLPDGTLGVTYFDLRSEAGNPETLMTDYWLARSRDGLQWTETRVTAPFDLRIAPLSGSALFIGDYMGLASAGTDFVPFYVRTVDTANRTDVFATRITPAGALAALATTKRDAAGEANVYRAAPMPDREPDAAYQRIVSENIVRAMEARIPGWSKARRRPR